MALIFDLETIILPDDKLMRVAPKELVSPEMPEEVKNPFVPKMDDIQAPKNYTNPYKIKEYKAAKFAELNQLAMGAKDRWREEIKKQWQAFCNEAALNAAYSYSPMSGFLWTESNSIRVNVFETDKGVIEKLSKMKLPENVSIKYSVLSEENYIKDIFQVFKYYMSDEHGKLITFNGHLFDVPYLIRRGWINGMVTPLHWMRPHRYWDEKMIDLLEWWRMGDRQTKTGGLGSLCKIMGIDGKTGSGEKFGELYKSDPVAAVEYQIQDLKATAQLAKAMGVT